MDTSFDELKAFYAQVRSHGYPPDFDQRAINILSEHGIKLRNKDGSEPKVTLSPPTSKPDSLVLGVRYKKINGTKTEDHFLFQQDKEIIRCYGKKLEKLCPEYKGTHKLQR